MFQTLRCDQHKNSNLRTSVTNFKLRLPSILLIPIGTLLALQSLHCAEFSSKIWPFTGFEQYKRPLHRCQFTSVQVKQISELSAPERLTRLVALNVVYDCCSIHCASSSAPPIATPSINTCGVVPLPEMACKLLVLIPLAAISISSNL